MHRVGVPPEDVSPMPEPGEPQGGTPPRRYWAGLGVKCSLTGFPEAQVSRSRWPGLARTALHRSPLGERQRHVGAGLFSGVAVIGGNLSNTQEG